MSFPHGIFVNVDIAKSKAMESTNNIETMKIVKHHFNRHSPDKPYLSDSKGIRTHKHLIRKQSSLYLQCTH